MRMERRLLTATLPKSSVHSSRLPRLRKGRMFCASAASLRSRDEACGAARRRAGVRRSAGNAALAHSTHIDAGARPPPPPGPRGVARPDAGAHLGALAALDDDLEPDHVEAHEPERQPREERGQADQDADRHERARRHGHLSPRCASLDPPRSSSSPWTGSLNTVLGVRADNEFARLFGAKQPWQARHSLARPLARPCALSARG